jgi:hypothetical protein
LHRYILYYPGLPGFLLIVEAARRYKRYREAIRIIREKETELGSEIGDVETRCK